MAPKPVVALGFIFPNISSRMTVNIQASYHDNYVAKTITWLSSNFFLFTDRVMIVEDMI